MKYPSYLLLSLTLLLTCCGSAQAPRPSNNDLVRTLSSQTVALIVRDEDGDVGPFCSGVWAGPELILTAGHCAVAMASDESKVIGTTIAYIVQEEVTGHFKEPKTYHKAVVVKLDADHDLALLAAPHPPVRGIAHLAPTAPVAGDTLHFIGHATGYYYTYMRGTMSQTWTNLYANPRPGPWMQVSAPIAKGMSGSGAFDEVGRLVGICSAVSASTPDVGFYVHLSTIREFVGHS